MVTVVVGEMNVPCADIVFGGIKNPCWLVINSNWALSEGMQALVGRNSYLFIEPAGIVVNVKMESVLLPQHEIGIVPELNPGEMGLKCSRGSVEAGIGDELDIGVTIGVGKSV